MKTPLSKPYITQEIKDAVLRVIDGGNFILGKESEAFEKEMAAHTGVKHCVLSANWTAAIYLLCYALKKTGKLKEGDEIIMPSHTAFPSCEPFIHHGVVVKFVDIDDTYTVDPALIEKAITKRTVGILPVHIYGQPCNMDRIKALAMANNLWIIEDCAQAQGAKYKGARVGSMTMAAGFSFFPSKNLTVFGDGGAITTNDDELAELVRKLRNHGKRDKFTNDMIGFNLRFNEINAAIGRIQLRELDRLNQGRRDAVALYRKLLTGVKGLVLPPERPGCEPVYHMFVIQVNDRDKLAKFFAEKGVSTGIHYPIACHQQPAIKALYKNIPSLPMTEFVVGRILSLPIYGEITPEQVTFTSDCIKEFLKA
ncbi:MAG: DegT/DnrJ/EryC1/StrS family aminotransferase [Verrucomicrobia bacterium]|nr:DegT/DnrJ/EryC1/StrS family aminotransferase [Verrucomicrobiota bacterium]